MVRFRGYDEVNVLKVKSCAMVTNLQLFHFVSGSTMAANVTTD